MTKAQTQAGWVEGEQRAAHLAFRGIPFAKAPVGRLRFRPPEPPEPWNGVRPAHRFGPSAIQEPGKLASNSVPEPLSEDCLYLNVFTPGVDGARRPVFFWIHGGGFQTGAGGEALYDGGALAERGDVVVVTINYRLGALGFLYVPEDERSRSGARSNAGLLDQLAALEWVRDNVAAFGGNPDDVTLAGESAGAYSVACLLCAPRAFGLFHRAIAQSGASFTRVAGDPLQPTAALYRALGLPDARLELLRDVPAERFVAAQQRVSKQFDTAFDGVSVFTPQPDGDLLPLPLAAAVASGACARVPLLLGTTRDEINLFLGAALKKLSDPLDEPDYFQRLGRAIRNLDPGRARELTEVYRRSRVERGLPHSPRALLAAVRSDAIWRIPTLRFAEAYRLHQPATFVYLFSYESPAMRGAMRSAHALELGFMFGTLDAPGQREFAGEGEPLRRLSDRMMDAWLAFVRGSDPSLPGHAWPAHSPERRPTMVFDRESGLALAPYEEERAAWDGLTPRGMIG